MEVSRSNYLLIQDISARRQTGIYCMVRNVLDFWVSLCAVILTSPLLLIIALLIKLDSPGPAFYTQERMGYLGNSFKVYKFRSMFIDAEQNGPCWAKENDPRITRVGRLLRLTRMDELPQFINVLKGEMSIIGPRPERPVFIEEFSKEIPDFAYRLAVKPGITGWAQVNGGYDCTPAEKLDLDLYYIENDSLWLDLKIILKTLSVVFTGKGAR